MDTKCFRCSKEVESCEDPLCEECYKTIQEEYRKCIDKQSIKTGRNLFELDKNIIGGNTMQMEDMLNEIVEEEIQKEGFRVDDDNKAEWALQKIAQEQEELKRFTSVCKYKIEEYQEKINKAEQSFITKTDYFRQQLKEYFATVKTKSTKTQETYKLPSGKLVLKYPSVKFSRDEKVFTEWLKNNNYNEFIKIEEKADWKEFKKSINVSGNDILTEDGEIVEGITAVETEPEFKIEV